MPTRLFFPATARNRGPISEVLATLFARPCHRVLEVASGSGEHAVAFAADFPHLQWFPTDADPAHLESIDAWREYTGLTNVAPARRLDLLQDAWPELQVDAVFCANLIHIAPWEVTEALLRGAATVLGAGGQLVLYGPYRRKGVQTAPSNEAFDASLRARDPRWGVRDLETVVATANGFRLAQVVEMPANNLMVVLGRGD